MHDPIAFRSEALRGLTNRIGVYALCDLDGTPLYVGQSVDGIRTRVRRHLTSARSDIVANRQIDVWEVAFVWAWPTESKADIALLEAHLFSEFDAQSPLLNGKPLGQGLWAVNVPDKQSVQVIEESERLSRMQPSMRLPRQIAQYLTLVDYVLVTKNAPHLNKALEAHFVRMRRYHDRFLR